MVDGNWEIGKPAPFVGRGVVDLDHFGCCAAGDDAAESDDLRAKGYGRVLAESAGWDGGEDGPGLGEGRWDGRETGEENSQLQTHCGSDITLSRPMVELPRHRGNGEDSPLQTRQ